MGTLMGVVHQPVERGCQALSEVVWGRVLTRKVSWIMRADIYIKRTRTARPFLCLIGKELVVKACWKSFHFDLSIHHCGSRVSYCFGHDGNPIVVGYLRGQKKVRIENFHWGVHTWGAIGDLIWALRVRSLFITTSTSWPPSTIWYIEYHFACRDVGKTYTSWSDEMQGLLN